VVACSIVEKTQTSIILSGRDLVQSAGGPSWLPLPFAAACPDIVISAHQGKYK